MIRYEDWIAGLSRPRLTALLFARPDVALDPPPRTHAALAHLLRSERSVRAVLRSLDRGALSVLAVVEARTVLTREQLAVELGEGSVNSADDVNRALATLVASGSAWPAGDGYRCSAPDVPRRDSDEPPHLAPPLLPPREAAEPDDVQLAVTRFAEMVDAVLVAVESRSIATMKAGGVGIREVRTLAKDVGAEHESEVELALSLAAEARLLDSRGPALRCTTEVEAWRSAGRSEQITTVVAAWWNSETSFTNRSLFKGKAIPVLSSSPPNPSTTRLRQRMLAIVPDGGFVGDDNAREYFEWAMPEMIASANPGDAAAVWCEASMLGIVIDGAATELSVALGELGAAESGEVAPVFGPAVARLLARARSTLRLLPDLTAVVTGPVSPELSSLLTGSAEREARGAASTWRFTPTSVRGYLDGGGDAEALLDTLANTAVTDVPQSLDYLIRDCARTHGSVTVFTGKSAVVSADESLIEEIAMRKIVDAQRIAPTVLLASSSARTTLDALRAAGYSPVADGESGAVKVSRAEPRPTVSGLAWTGGSRTDPVALADALVSGEPLPVDLESVTATIRRWCRLPARDTDALARAVADGTSVLIDVSSAPNGIVRHRISDAVFDSGTVHAWSSRADGRRSFDVSLIRMIVNAPD